MAAFLWLTGIGTIPLSEAKEPTRRGTTKVARKVPLGSAHGDFLYRMEYGGQSRSCVVHLPTSVDLQRPAPLVLVLHGAAMNASMMAGFSGMNEQAMAGGFIAVYPNGTGLQDSLLIWNSGGVGPVREKPDDVGFLRALLEELTPKLKVDQRRIYAAGMSNGGMMCYRLAAQMSDKIAAIAAVGGTLAIPDPRPERPVPVIHFHGTDDRIVPYLPAEGRAVAKDSFLDVPTTIRTWVKLNGCPELPVIQKVPDRFEDGTQVTIQTHAPGKSGSEVVLVEIVGGGHTWPGQQPAFSFIGRSTREISANRLIWEFFQKHPLPVSP